MYLGNTEQVQASGAAVCGISVTHITDQQVVRSVLILLPQRGYLPSRDTLLNSLLGEANANNVGATMVWEWIAWYIDDSSYSFDTSDDGSNGVRAQINYMRSKVSTHALPSDVCCCVGIAFALLNACEFASVRSEHSAYLRDKMIWRGSV